MVVRTRTVALEKIRDEVKRLYIESCYDINPDLMDAFKKAGATEESPLGKEILDTLVENASLARHDQIPMCQDTGLAVVLVELGEQVRLDGKGSFRESIDAGVAQAAKEGYLRRSVVRDPLFDRKNTGDNTPAMVHVEVVPGDRLRIIVAAKGTGSENMSALRMMKPSDGAEGVKKFVVDTVKNAGSNPCPPIIVGVGIGGSFELCAFLAKKALFRPLNQKNRDPNYAKLEDDILEAVNRTGIGPQGLGGRTTALAVHIEQYPCHIGALPVAINLNCHAHRYKEVVL